MKSFIRKSLLALVMTGALPLHLAFCQFEDYIDPTVVKVSTPLYRPSFRGFDPKLGTYTYSVSWEGIPAAEAKISIDEVDDQFKVVANANTYSAIDLFYTLRYQAEGLLSAVTLEPSKLEINHQENSRIKKISMSFLPNGEVSAVRSQNKADSERSVKFNSHNLMLDPIGAAFLARSLDWDVGQTRTFDVFNGKSRYLISLSAIEKTTIEYQGALRKVVVISPKVRNLTTTKVLQKLRNAKIYMSDDRSRDILRIVSSVFIGSVTTELESFEAKADPVENIRLAQLRREFEDSQKKPQS